MHFCNEMPRGNAPAARCIYNEQLPNRAVPNSDYGSYTKRNGKKS